MKKYDSYKDSDVEWIGEIPSHWDCKRLKHLVESPLKYGANEAAESDDPSQPRYIRITDFGQNGILRDDTFKSLPEHLANEYLLEEGDILLARSGATVGKTFLFQNYNGKACFAGYLIRCRFSKEQVDSRFINYYTFSNFYENWKQSIFQQATIQNIGADKYNQLLVTIPPQLEQTAIANYLDQKTTQLDDLIAKKERLIQLLEEERTAIINQAVTKGLDPTVPMKDSGIEWLGEIPAHWEVKKLKYVADKYQTGFDQPLLHTMYVDKKLSGVKAVQTLSRLNRMCAGKEDTFVLDFANDTQDILDSFQPYYELTSIAENSDPNHLYDLKSELEKANVIWEAEVTNFCNVFFKSSKSLNASEQKKLNAYIDPAVERFKALPEETNEVIGSETNRDDFKNALQTFCRTYSFLTQIMPFSDVDLEKLFTYGRFLLKKLPRTSQNDKFKLGDEVSLEYYRLQKIAEHNIALESQGVYELEGGGQAGIRLTKEEEANLSEIIEVLNKKFQTEFNTADKLFFDQIEEELVVDDGLKEQAQNNSIDNFKFGFEELFLDKLIGRMEQNQDIFTKMMDDKEFGDVVKGYMLKKVYERLLCP